MMKEAQDRRAFLKTATLVGVAAAGIPITSTVSLAQTAPVGSAPMEYPIGTKTDWNGTHYETVLTPRETSGKRGAFASHAGLGGAGPPEGYPTLENDKEFVEGRLRFWRAGE